MSNNNKPIGGNKLFGNTQTQSTNNIFGSNHNQQQQGANMFNNNTQQGGNMFNNQNQGGNIFGNNQQQNQQSVNIFGNNQQQNQQQGTNIFGNNANTNTGGNIFGNNQQNKPLFGNNNQQQTGTSNIFVNQQQQQGSNLFNNQGQTGGNNMFNTQQQSNNLFSNQQQQPQNNLFSNQQQTQNNMFGNQQQQAGNVMNTGFVSGNNNVDAIRFQIQQYSRKIDPKNLQYIRIDELNMFRDQRIGNLDQQAKNSICILLNNMRQLRAYLDEIKKHNQELDKKATQYCQNVQQKLIKYKECLIQNVSQSNLLEEAKQEIELIQKQVNGFIIPLYNAHKSGKHHYFDSPDEFSSIIAKKLLQKMMVLNNKIDEIISCQKTNQDDSINQQQANSILVLQQLLNYYQNVAARVLQFSNKYNSLKKVAIQKNRRSTSSYEDTMRKIQDKVDTKMQKDFRCYDLIKEIQGVLQKRQKRQKEAVLNYEKSLQKKSVNTMPLGNQERWKGYH